MKGKKWLLADYENQNNIRSIFEIMFDDLSQVRVSFPLFYNVLLEIIQSYRNPLFSLQDIAKLTKRQTRLRILMDSYLGGHAAPGGIL